MLGNCIRQCRSFSRVTAFQRRWNSQDTRSPYSQSSSSKQTDLPPSSSDASHLQNPESSFQQAVGSESRATPPGVPGPTTVGGVTADTLEKAKNLFSSDSPESSSCERKTTTPEETGQGATKAGGAPTWTIAPVRRDHDLVRQNLDRLKNLTNKDEKQRVFNDTIKMLAQHDVAEEVVIYPAAKRLGDEALYNLAIEQTIKAERLLYNLDQDFGLDVDKYPNFNERVDEFRNVLMEHVDMEEQELLPHLEKNLSSDDIESLNTWFERVKMLSPTRPHPEGPHGAVGALATGPIVAFLDSIRDLTKKFS